MGAMAWALTMWFWPGSVRYVASGRASARARVPLVIQSGLLPPTATSVGALIAAQSAGVSGIPCWWWCIVARSYGRVGATALSLPQTGVSGITAVKMLGVPT